MKDPELSARATAIEGRINAIITEEMANSASHAVVTRAVSDVLLKHFHQRWTDPGDFDRFLNMLRSLYKEMTK